MHFVIENIVQIRFRGVFIEIHLICFQFFFQTPK